MRLAAILLVLVAHGAAHADVGLGGSLHAGLAVANNQVYGYDGDESPSGLGWMVDGEAGLRLHPLVSVQVAFTYASLHETAQWSDLGNNVEDLRDHYLDGVLRVRFHNEGRFLGAGVGYEVVHETGSVTCTDGCDVMFASAVSRSDVGPLVEIHGGYTFDPIGRVAPQLFASAQRAWIGDGAMSFRVALGVAF